MSSSDLVTLILDDGGRLESKKSTLVKASPYFEAMFNKGFVEADQSEVKISGPLDLDALKELIRNSSGYNLDLNDENVFLVLQAAGMLQFENARIQCLNYLKKSANLFETLSFCDVLGEQKLRNFCLQKILWGFSSIRSNFLSDTSPNVIREVLGHPHLRVNSEMDVFQAISDWIEVDAEKRSTHFVDLFECVRLDEMSFEDLSDLIHFYLVAENPDSKKSVETEIQSRKKIKNKSSPSVKRGPQFLPCVVARIKKKHWICTFDQRSKSLEKFLELDKMCMTGNVFATGYQVCAAGPVIYVIGGEFMLGRSNWNRSVWTYDTLTDEWNHVINLDIGMRHFSTCVCLYKPGQHEKSEIFLVGGFGKHRIILDQMSSIKLKNNIIQECPALPDPMYSPAVTYFRGRIFVIDNYVYSYHPEYKQWSRIDGIHLPKQFEFNNSMATKDFIYLTANHCDQLFRFDPDSQTPIHPQMIGKFKSEVQNVCLVESEQTIYNFSTDDVEPISMIETYTIEEQRFDVVWKSEDSDFDFSPNFSFGCFAMPKF